MDRPVSKTARIIDGQLIFNTAQDRVSFKNELKLFSDDTEVRVTVCKLDTKKEEEEKRTLQQNKYYHKLLEILASETGYTHEEMHMELKIKFLSKPYVKGDKEYTIIGSTKELTTKTFGDYLEQVFAWASTELNVILPNPNEF